MTNLRDFVKKKEKPQMKVGIKTYTDLNLPLLEI